MFFRIIFALKLKFQIMSKVSKSITIDNDLNSRIEELRVAERRTFSGMISIILENYLRDRGISPSGRDVDVMQKEYHKKFKR